MRDDGVAQLASLAGKTQPLSQCGQETLFLREDDGRFAWHVRYYGPYHSNLSIIAQNYGFVAGVCGEWTAATRPVQNAVYPRFLSGDVTLSIKELDAKFDSRRPLQLSLLIGVEDSPLAELGLTVVRADHIGEAGMITAQVLEHLKKSNARDCQPFLSESQRFLRGRYVVPSDFR